MNDARGGVGALIMDGAKPGPSVGIGAGTGVGATPGPVLWLGLRFRTEAVAKHKRWAKLGPTRGLKLALAPLPMRGGGWIVEIGQGLQRNVSGNEIGLGTRPLY